MFQTNIKSLNLFPIQNRTRCKILNSKSNALYNYDFENWFLTCFFSTFQQENGQ